jgi:hypothetical protein
MLVKVSFELSFILNIIAYRWLYILSYLFILHKGTNKNKIVVAKERDIGLLP